MNNNNVDNNKINRNIMSDFEKGNIVEKMPTDVVRITGSYL